MSAPRPEYTLEALTTKGFGGKEPNVLIIGCDYPNGREHTPKLAEGVRMSISTQVIFWVMGAFGYLGSPIILIWGWVQWLRQPKTWTIPAAMSMTGFVLATASALLAVSSIAFAQFHHFPYYDPLLLRIFRTGTSLSLGGIAFGVSGAWRATSLRWHAPISGVATFAFWFMAATGE